MACPPIGGGISFMITGNATDEALYTARSEIPLTADQTSARGNSGRVCIGG